MTHKIFVSHSSHTENARKLCNEVAECIKGEAGLEPLWDKTISPGQRWRSDLDQWLAECDGGIILFSEDAIRSSWVLKEAQILTWRKARSPAFPLIPVLLDPVEATATGLDDWQPVRINEIQFLPGADPETLTDAARRNLARQIVDALKDAGGGVETGNRDDPLSEWIANLADDLANAGLPRLRSAAQTLGIARDAVHDDSTEAWAYLVACRLLHFGCAPAVIGNVQSETFDAAAEALKNIVRTFPDSAKRRVADQFFPLWVNPDAARHVCPSRVAGVAVGINGRYWETGRQYADRATCGMTSDRKAYVAVTDIHDGNPESIWKRYHQELVEKFRLHELEPTDWNDGAQLAAWRDELEQIVVQRGPVFIVLHGDACSPLVVKEIRQRYQSFGIILMLGEQTKDVSNLQLGEVKLLEPCLASRREAQVQRLYEMLV